MKVIRITNTVFATQPGGEAACALAGGSYHRETSEAAARQVALNNAEVVDAPAAVEATFAEEDAAIEAAAQAAAAEEKAAAKAATKAATKAAKNAG